MSKLKNKVAVITGGSTGIGFATAKRFVEEGAYVYIVGRRQQELDRAVGLLGTNAAGIQGDVSHLADLERVYQTIHDSGRKLDIVFANAAIIEMAPLGMITEEMVDRQYGVNVKGVIFTVQQALPLLNDGGTIILTGSIGAVKGSPGQSVYTSSKATLRSLVRTWLLELKARKIRVNIVTPGGFDTEGIAALFPDGDARKAFDAGMASMTPMGRIGQPAELANVVAFLASDEASYINGADFQVDGGLGQI